MSGICCQRCLKAPCECPFKPPMPTGDTAPQPPNPPGEFAQAITAGLIEKRARYIRQLEEKIARQRVDLRKEKELREAAEKQRALSLDVNADLRQRIAALEAQLAEAQARLAELEKK